MGRGKQKIHEGQKIMASNQYTKGKIVAQIGNPGKIDTSRKYATPPAKPKFITGKAALFWKRYTRTYQESGRLNKDTWPLYCQLSEAWGRWQDFVEMRREMFEANPKGRGLIMKEGESTITKQNGETVRKGGAIKVSIPADRAEKAEKHFSDLFGRFLEISDRFAEKKTEYDPFSETY